MKRAVLFAMCLGAAACMKPAEPNAATKAAESGLDPASFDQSGAAAGRSVPSRQRQLADQDRDSRGQGLVRRVRHPVRQGAGRPARHRRRSREVDDQDAGFRGAEDRRLLRELHERAARRATRPHAAQGGARCHRRHQDQDRPGAPLRPLLQAESDQSDRRLRRRRRAAADQRHSLPLPGRPRPSRSRLLPQERRQAEGVSREVRRLCRQHSRPGRRRQREQVGARDLRARDAARPRALDQRREPRRGEDLQQGRRRRSCRSSSPASTGTRGRRSSASTACRRSSSASRVI